MVNGLHLYSAFIQSASQFLPLIHPFTHERQLAAMQGTNQLVRSNWGLGVLLRDTSTCPGWDRTGNPPTARRQLYLLSHIAPNINALCSYIMFQANLIERELDRPGEAGCSVCVLDWIGQQEIEAQKLMLADPDNNTQDCPKREEARLYLLVDELQRSNSMKCLWRFWRNSVATDSVRAYL